ncbi:O-linked N-acetylglucosamine transferase, SPINDLY family protein [Pseudazoarcus pumilus]|uniref:protein O-GlcNAc transferase n=1 Tax=Pseudazoarcus pumilus TaxID=2067960 RepID=A0A2I6S904_9RHOO|nr:tetratricopeptide repeat protein [Pseudazoarcus pumilus]AUN95740.1 hypothetical protein C0099_12840 [Pseudazoarcus pumilus]
MDPESCAALVRKGEFHDAATLAESILAGDPQCSKAWYFLGLARLLLNEHEAACLAFEQTISRLPNHSAAFHYLAIALQRLERRARASEMFQRSLALCPDVAHWWANAAANAFECRRFKDAVELAGKAISIDRTTGSAWLVRGNALFEMGDFVGAVAALERAAEQLPDREDVRAGLALAYDEVGRGNEALALLDGLVRKSPTLIEGQANYATVLLRHGYVEEAIKHFRVALGLNPERLNVWTSYLFALTHSARVSLDEGFGEHCRFGRIVERPWRDRWGGWKCDPDPERRLRVGFVSGDLRNHPLRYFIEPVWEGLEPDTFEIFAYSSCPQEDAVSEGLRGKVSSWCNVHALDDDALASRIRSDRVDILVDLSGHTTYNRLTVFARKPAPLQLTWIGYPATTGLTAIDYRFVAAPADFCRQLAPCFTEKLIALGDAVIFRPEAVLPPVTPPPVLERGQFTFGSFNRLAKVSASTIALWARVLTQVPDARLLIGAIDDERSGAKIVEALTRLGVGRDRLELRPRVGMADYLRMHAEVDLLLDTVPYAGGTTTNHALWMGVPTLSLDGGGLQQRSGSGRMRALGLDEWIAADEDDYVTKAVAAASRTEPLVRLRSTLRERLEQRAAETTGSRRVALALRAIWRRWCSGASPDFLDLSD